MRELLVTALINTQSVEGSLSDITLFTNTLATVTSNPEENSEDVEVSTLDAVDLLIQKGGNWFQLWIMFLYSAHL